MIIIYKKWFQASVLSYDVVKLKSTTTFRKWWILHEKTSFALLYQGHL